METISTGLKWWEAVLCLVAGGYATWATNVGFGLLCALAAGIAFGVWRMVRIQGKQLEFVQQEALDRED